MENRQREGAEKIVTELGVEKELLLKNKIAMIPFRDLDKSIMCLCGNMKVCIYHDLLLSIKNNI